MAQADVVKGTDALFVTQDTCRNLSPTTFSSSTSHHPQNTAHEGMVHYLNDEEFAAAEIIVEEVEWQRDTGPMNVVIHRSGHLCHRKGPGVEHSALEVLPAACLRFAHPSRRNHLACCEAVHRERR